MRLYEISSLTKDQLTPKMRATPQDVGQDFKQDGDRENIGSGMYATAFSTVQEPGTVRKISNAVDNLEHDAYFQYINMITKNDRMSGNPYFPKVFDIQVRSFYRKDYTGERNLGVLYAYAVDLERLLAFSLLSSEEARMLGNKIFYDFEKRHRPGRTVSGSPKIDYRDELSSKIEYMFIKHDWAQSQLKTIIKDRYFKQAVLLIMGMINKSDRMQEDIHDENIMIRRGPGGPQIVITDPVSGG